VRRNTAIVRERLNIYAENDFVSLTEIMHNLHASEFTSPHLHKEYCRNEEQ
jgi:hypothetical protein